LSTPVTGGAGGRNRAAADCSAERPTPRGADRLCWREEGRAGGRTRRGRPFRSRTRRRLQTRAHGCAAVVRRAWPGLADHGGATSRSRPRRVLAALETGARAARGTVGSCRATWYLGCSMWYSGYSRGGGGFRSGGLAGQTDLRFRAGSARRTASDRLLAPCGERKARLCETNPKEARHPSQGREPQRPNSTHSTPTVPTVPPQYPQYPASAPKYPRYPHSTTVPHCTHSTPQYPRSTQRQTGPAPGSAPRRGARKQDDKTTEQVEAAPRTHKRKQTNNKITEAAPRNTHTHKHKRNHKQDDKTTEAAPRTHNRSVSRSAGISTRSSGQGGRVLRVL
jgi:hypothetical protein